MRHMLAFIVVAAATCYALNAHADLKQYGEDLGTKARTVDSDGLAREPIQHALQAGCTVNNALEAGIAGDSKRFADDMDAARPLTGGINGPDFGTRSFDIFVHTAIPRTDADTTDKNQIQAIANTAAFHFAFIEVGGSSLYPTLAQRLRVLWSCESCSVSARPRPCISRPGRTRPAMRMPALGPRPIRRLRCLTQ